MSLMSLRSPKTRKAAQPCGSIHTHPHPTTKTPKGFNNNNPRRQPGVHTHPHPTTKTRKAAQPLVPTHSGPVPRGNDSGCGSI